MSPRTIWIGSVFMAMGLLPPGLHGANTTMTRSRKLTLKVRACRLGADNKHPRTEEEPRSSASSNRVDIKLRSLDGDPRMK